LFSYLFLLFLFLFRTEGRARQRSPLIVALQAWQR